MTQSILRGVGSYLPKKVLTNKDLEENIAKNFVKINSHLKNVLPFSLKTHQ